MPATGREWPGQISGAFVPPISLSSRSAATPEDAAAVVVVVGADSVVSLLPAEAGPVSLPGMVQFFAAKKKNQARSPSG